MIPLQYNLSACLVKPLNSLLNHFFAVALLFSTTIQASEESAVAPAAWVDDLSPITTLDWNFDRAAHLLERAGFGGTPEEIEKFAAMSPVEAVDHLVDYESVTNTALLPFEQSGVFDEAMDPFPASRAEAVRQARENGESMGVKLAIGQRRPVQPVVNKFFYGLRANSMESRRLALWWANRMLATRRPLQEKMTLFWHGHFATTDTKVRDYRKMLMQLELFQRHAVGNFGELLLAITQDPAMLTFLDSAQNVKEHPNENFGRELMELFSLGDGNYTERDIREAARAFTGWADEKLQFVKHTDRHDEGIKTVLGQSGNFDGEDIIAILLQQDVTSRFMSEKLYRFFVREQISPTVQDSLATLLVENDYQLAPLLKTVFLSKDFYSSASIATQVKSPVHLLVSTYKKMGLTNLPGIPDFNSATGALGQTLLYPPNVAGWAGGPTWITPATLMQRGNLAREILFPNVEAYQGRDRRLPGVYRRVGERLAQGMNITEATMDGSGSSSYADADEDYNTRYGVYMGYQMAFGVIKDIPRFPAAVDLVSMLRGAGVTTTEQSVEYFVKRFLRLSLTAEDTLLLTQYLEEEIGSTMIDYSKIGLNDCLKRLLHLVLSTPEYQLS